MSTDIIIRHARPSDAHIIADFNSRLASETEHKTLEQARLLQGVSALLDDERKGVYYLAESQGTVVGQLMITQEWSDWRNGVFWWIQSVYVRREWRGKGVFRRLYDHVHTKARADRSVCGLRLYVEEENERAQSTYRGLGMRSTSYRLFETDFTEGTSS